MIVKGGKVMIVGDLHFSDVFTGRHKNYLENCCEVLGQLTKMIEERKPSVVVLEGDIIGWNETNIKSRQVFSMFCRTLKEWNSIAKVVCVQGNHDTKGYPDYLFLKEFGLISNPEYFDYCTPNGDLEVRFHIVNYGDEHRQLDIAENASNVVLGHNNYTINGVTTWYSAGDGIELNSLENFCGVDYVISGHIHNPSPDVYPAYMKDESTCNLIYPGCPTRPIREKNMYDAVWIVGLEYNGTSTDLSLDIWELRPSEELFDDNIIEDRDEDDEAELMRKQALQGVLSDLLTYRMAGGDPLAQIDNIPNASEEAKRVAKS